MSEAGGLTSTDYRLGFHKPIGRAWQPIIYSAVEINGILYAVVDACILIGTVEEQEQVVARLRAQGNARSLFTDPDLVLQGGAIKGESYRWKNARVPFEIAGDLPNPERVTQAIDHWVSKTKIRFEAKKREDADYVVFVRAGGCASFVGRRGGKQEIFVGDACTRGNLIHEIGHCVGFYHEQSRSDRNDFVDIKWQNVDPVMRHNFNQEDSDNLSTYDFGSIMHYPANAFSTNSQDTIVPKRPLPTGIMMGQRDGLSSNDIAAVAKLYP
jgi:hypothetical protein